MSFFRCTAPVADIDLGQYVRCSHAHTDNIVEEYELSVIWDEYGIVGDIVVGVLPSCFGSRS